MKGLIFTYLMTYGGAVASLLNPFVGLLVYISFAIIKPDYMWSWDVPKGNYSRIVALALTVGWMTQAFGRWRQEGGDESIFTGLLRFLIRTLLSAFALIAGFRIRELGRSQIVVAALFGYLLWAVLGWLFAANDQVASAFVESLGKIVLPFLVGITTITTTKQLRQLAWVILLSQGYLAYEMNLSYFQGYNRIVEEGFAEMDNNSVAIGMVTCLWLGFFLGLSAERWWQKAIALVLAGLMGHTVMIAFSRGGMLAILVSGLATFLLIPKKPRHYLAFALAVVIGLRLAGPEVRQRFFTTFAGETDRESSAGSRLALWKDCLDCMVKQPLLGVGPDHWPLVAASYGWPAGKEAHSLWLQLGAELGIPGLLLLLLFYGSCMGKLWPLTRERTEVPDPWLRHAARMVIASIVGFAAAAQFVSLKGLEVPFYVALVGAGALKLASAPGWYPEVDRILPGRLRPINTKTQTVEA